MTPTHLTLHRDGTVTYWSVYRQVWNRHVYRLPDRELAAMSAEARERILRHFKKYARLAAAPSLEAQPHEIYGSGIDHMIARLILHVLKRDGMQDVLNYLAKAYDVCPPGTDDATVRQRLRNLAEGFLQFEARQHLKPRKTP